jgi:hypothetical protein
MRRFVTLLLVAFAQLAISASLPIQVVPLPSSSPAGKGNTEVVYIVVRLSAIDGSPRSGLGLPAFKGWTMRLLSSPNGFVRTQAPLSTVDAFNRTQTIQVAASCTIVMRKITEIDKGVYSIAAAPIVFAVQQPASQAPTPWIEGEYLFRVSVADGVNTGDILGTFTIR